MGTDNRILDVVFDGDRTPVDNMVLDEAALADSDSPARLRLYGWQPSGVSIGYFQPARGFCELVGAHHTVRRTTGGGAIHHADEITFALTCDEGALSSSLDERYTRLHAAIARALRAFDVPTLSCGGGSPAPRPQELWCFGRAACHDLVTAGGGHKIVGSAQRRASGRVLHHGSVVLRQPSLGPRCGAIADFLDPTPIEAGLRRRIAIEVARELQLNATTRPTGWLEDPPNALRETIRKRLARR